MKRVLLDPQYEQYARTGAEIAYESDPDNSDGSRLRMVVYPVDGGGALLEQGVKIAYDRLPMLRSTG